MKKHSHGLPAFVTSSGNQNPTSNKKTLESPTVTLKNWNDCTKIIHTPKRKISGAVGDVSSPTTQNLLYRKSSQTQEEERPQPCIYGIQHYGGIDYSVGGHHYYRTNKKESRRRM